MLNIQQQQQQLILFDQSKNCASASFHKLLNRKLNAFNFKSSIIKDDLNLNSIFEAALLIFAGPRKVFSLGEFAVLKSYMDVGGSILYLIGQGGETDAGTNLNYFLEEFGMSVNSDCVVQTCYTPNLNHFHPKQALIAHPFVNSQFKKLVDKAKTAHSNNNHRQLSSLPDVKIDSSPNDTASKPSCVFPFGATLNVQSPSIPLLSTGSMCHPINRPIAGIYLHPNGKGKLAVISSLEFISDQYLDQFDNAHMVVSLITYLTNIAPQHLITDSRNECGDLNDYHYVPDVQSISGRPRICLQDTEQVPSKFTHMFDTSLYALDLALVPKSIQAFQDLRLPQNPLTLIAPTFESPLPPLSLSVFPPLMHDVPAPKLELFDLDVHLAPQTHKLLQLAAKCQDVDLDVYLTNAARILNIRLDTRVDSTSELARSVLDYVVTKIIQWKMV